MIKDNSIRNGQQFWNTYSVPKTMPKGVLACPFVVITTTLCERNYPHMPFSDEGAETQKDCPLSKAT